MKDQKSKLPQEGGNKSMVRAYCPIIDMVVEAESQEEWEAKVKEIIKGQGK